MVVLRCPRPIASQEPPGSSESALAPSGSAASSPPLPPPADAEASVSASIVSELPATAPAPLEAGISEMFASREPGSSDSRPDDASAPLLCAALEAGLVYTCASALDGAAASSLV